LKAVQLLRVLALAAALTGGVQAIGLSQSQPGHDIDQKQICLDCHDLSDALSSRVSHSPVAAGECTACHNPHVARFPGLLKQRTAPLCVSCHSGMKRHTTSANSHAPVGKGDCLACHEPHGSANAGLLGGSTKEVCGQCHAQVEIWSEREVQHTPFAQGRCGTCHDPHSSDHPALAKASGASMCLPCHQMNSGLRAAHRGYPVEKAACHQCHEPHAAARSGLFRESIHSPFGSGDCGGCHQSATARNPFSTVKPIDELCGECHDGAVEDSRKAGFPHVSAGGGRCVSCHNPHTGEGEAILRQDLEQVCSRCHDPGGGKSGEPGRYSNHAEEIECTSCHDPHGGQRPILLASESIELCRSCHEHQHSSRHPLGEDFRDPRTHGALTCLSCHGIHEAPADHLLHATDDGVLCIQCHTEIGRPPS